MAEAANEKTVEDPSREHELLKALERETNTCKRQELLKALWRLRPRCRALIAGPAPPASLSFQYN